MAGESKPIEIPKTPWTEPEKRRRGIGLGFELGLTFGSAYNFAKGAITNHASTFTSTTWPSRFRSGFTYARANCLRTCGAVGGLFMIGDLLDNALVHYRRKDDPLNTFASCAVVAATATARHGPIVSSCTGLGFGTFVALLHYFDPIIDAKLVEYEKRYGKGKQTPEVHRP